MLAFSGFLLGAKILNPPSWVLHAGGHSLAPSLTKMLSRFILRRLHFCWLTLTPVTSNPAPSSSSQSLVPLPRILHLPNPGFTRHLLGPSRTFSSNGKDTGDGGSWKFSPDTEDNNEFVFGSEEGALSGIAGEGGDPWSKEANGEKEGDIFEDIDREFKSKKEGGSDDAWETAKGYEPWGFGDGEAKERNIEWGEDGGEGEGGFEGLAHSVGKEGEKEKSGEEMRLEKEQQDLSTTLKGPNRAFGDLTAASGITEEMLDSLILLRDLDGVEGLPSLREIEDIRLAKDDAPSVRAEIERKKQEEVAKARVRQVDEKGRAYGTGRRKCSVARVWIQPGDGKFLVNDKEFDVYFPIIDDRAELLRPFTVTKTLGLWDVNCTVKGGGVSGQVGAVRLGISRALQNWEPGLRTDLRSEGYLTRDPRVVERKKPGKAKARKSFQWVKR